MEFPRLEIRQQYAKLGIDADIGKQDLQQPRPTFEMRQVRPELRLEQPAGRLEINQDRAWDALALGNHLETMNKIYSMASEMALEGLARIVENGNRMAAIHLPGNPFAELAYDWRRTFPEFDIRGYASSGNVELNYKPGDLSIRAIPGRIEIDAGVNPPIHNYERGKLNIYIQQYPNVQIIPPQIDLTI